MMAQSPDPAPASDAKERRPLLRLPWHLILSCTDWLGHKDFVCCSFFCVQNLTCATK